MTSYYVVPNSHTGAGIVKVKGNYAYIGAMGSGLFILDVRGCLEICWEYLYSNGKSVGL